MVDPQEPFQRTPNTQTAGWFLDLDSARKLDLDPPYQRRSVWSDSYRQFFIDSILRNYPTQSIFLQTEVDPDKPTVYRVLDGKQRLSSLLMFCRDEFMTPDSLADLQIARKYYSDLPKSMRVRIIGYVFTVETVKFASAADLNQAFDRLNRNVARLNKQELRHAQYGGAFATKMENLAVDEFWSEVGLVTPARVRRMLDVEYVSELYIVAMSGTQDGKDYLDDFYAENDDEIEDEAAVDRLFKRTKKYIRDVDQHLKLSATRFKNVADFYSLWTAACGLIRESQHLPAKEAAAALTELLAELEAQESQRATEYLLAARQGSNKKPNRELRAEIISSVIAGG